jgi:hypothetical protein
MSTNEILRESFRKVLDYKPTGKELTRQKEIEELAAKEKEEYNRKRYDFYNDPLHWDNNKRRRHHLPVLRGNKNKYRSKTFPAFHPTVRFFCTIEDMIDDVLGDVITQDRFFNQFVDTKNLEWGDKNVFRLK